MTGRFTRDVKVSTNDPGNAEVILKCQGEILEPLIMKPRSLNFGGRVSRSGGVQRMEVDITPGDGGPIQPEIQAGQTDNISFELREVSPGERYQLDVAVVPPPSGTIVHTRLIMATGVPEAPVIDVPVYATLGP